MKQKYRWTKKIDRVRKWQKRRTRERECDIIETTQGLYQTHVHNLVQIHLVFQEESKKKRISINITYFNGLQVAIDREWVWKQELQHSHRMFLFVWSTISNSQVIVTNKRTKFSNAPKRPEPFSELNLSLFHIQMKNRRPNTPEIRTLGYSQSTMKKKKIINKQQQ